MRPLSSVNIWLKARFDSARRCSLSHSSRWHAPGMTSGGCSTNSWSETAAGVATLAPEPGLKRQAWDQNPIGSSMHLVLPATGRSPGRGPRAAASFQPNGRSPDGECHGATKPSGGENGLSIGSYLGCGVMIRTYKIRTYGP